MAALSDTNFTAATGMAVGTSLAKDFPIGQIGDIVFWIGDYPSPIATNQSANIPTNNAAYTILEIRPRTAQIAGDTELTDQSNAIANNANTVANANFQDGAFNQTAGTYVGTTATTQVSRCWEYEIELNSNTDTRRWVHQTEITNKAGIEAYVVANFTTWTNP